MKVGDLVNYCWWVDRYGSDELPDSMASKKEEIGLIVATEESGCEGIRGDVKVRFAIHPVGYECTVPHIKLKAIE